MNTQVVMKRQNLEKTLVKLEWLLARSEQANSRYSRAQMEAFSILRDSFKERLAGSEAMPHVMHVETHTELQRCQA